MGGHPPSCASSNTFSGKTYMYIRSVHVILFYIWELHIFKLFFLENLLDIQLPNAPKNYLILRDEDSLQLLYCKEDKHRPTF